MSTPIQPAPSDPAEFFKPDDAIEQWKERPEHQPPSGFPPEVPRHPPNETPEWAPRTPQEVPLPHPTPMPDWSPSSGEIEAPVIDDPQNPTEHNSGAARASGVHDRPGTADLPPEEGGDPEEPGAQIVGSKGITDSQADSAGVGHTGPAPRLISEEACY